MISNIPTRRLAIMGLIIIAVSIVVKEPKLIQSEIFAVVIAGITGLGVWDRVQQAWIHTQLKGLMPYVKTFIDMLEKKKEGGLDKLANE